MTPETHYSTVGPSATCPVHTNEGENARRNRAFVCRSGSQSDTKFENKCVVSVKSEVFSRCCQSVTMTYNRGLSNYYVRPRKGGGGWVVSAAASPRKRGRPTSTLRRESLPLKKQKNSDTAVRASCCPGKNVALSRTSLCEMSFKQAMDQQTADN